MLHGLATMTYLHWIKGSPNFYEQGGEMNAMTFWEQVESDPSLSSSFLKKVMFIVPTVLCHAACHFGNYRPILTMINVLVWIVVIIAKMPFMNGVRILGINRTVGIDDEKKK